MNDKQIPSSIIDLTALNPAASVDTHSALKPLRDHRTVISIAARCASVKLFERYPNLKLATPSVEWRTLPFFRGIERLEVLPNS